jgi:hypothetical protein
VQRAKVQPLQAEPPQAAERAARKAPQAPRSEPKTSEVHQDRKASEAHQDACEVGKFIGRKASKAFLPIPARTISEEPA